jgi:hypothetical protein
VNFFYTQKPTPPPKYLTAAHLAQTLQSNPKATHCATAQQPVKIFDATAQSTLWCKGLPFTVANTHSGIRQKNATYR